MAKDSWIDKLRSPPTIEENRWEKLGSQQELVDFSKLISLEERATILIALINKMPFDMEMFHRSTVGNSRMRGRELLQTLKRLIRRAARRPNDIQLKNTINIWCERWRRVFTEASFIGSYMDSSLHLDRLRSVISVVEGRSFWTTHPINSWDEWMVLMANNHYGLWGEELYKLDFSARARLVWPECYQVGYDLLMERGLVPAQLSTGYSLTKRLWYRDIEALMGRAGPMEVFELCIGRQHIFDTFKEML